MKYWLRMGGANAITWKAWLMLSPISILFTWVVLPEGYAPTANPINGMLVGLIAHAATGLVLVLAKFTILRNSSIRPLPILTLLVFATAGAIRGLSASFFLEVFQVTERAEYGQRIIAGSILVLIWFAVSAVLVDGELNYRRSYSELLEELQRQISLRTLQRQALQDNQQQLLLEIRQTLHDALRVGRSPSEINNSVDQLIRPLAHRMATGHGLVAEIPKVPRRRVELGPVIKTALTKTPFNPLWTTLMAVLATLYSRLWQFGPIAFVDSAFTSLAIWGCFTIARKLKLVGIWVVPIWFVTGFIAASGTAFISGGLSIETLPNTLYLSINVIVPAAIISLIGAFDRNSEHNLRLLREVTEQVEWEVASLEQHAWVEQQRLARFVHSELQGRLRAFALKLELAGRTPSAEEIERLRVECEKSFPLQSEQTRFAEFITNTQQLWEGAVKINAQVSNQALDLLANDAYATAATQEICREAIVNAVKHGRAKSIHITLDSQEQSTQQFTLQLQVIDDGIGLQAGKKGMGLSEIEKLSIHYSLLREDNQTALSATIACSPNLALQT